MNRTAISIKNRLSLRPPQEESLNILVDLADKLELNKDIDLITELEKVKSSYPICSSFERDFVSICFSLATGVGKTRLMGAFVTYLYLEKGIKNFFVLAPNLTIYNKLIEDFSNPQHPKYVFKGIGEFSQTPPNIITGDNYDYMTQGKLFNSDVNINVFNISKINSETRSGKDAKIKRLSEYLGGSYFSYLSNLDDLVLLMDESHHYRADRGMQVINELKPILGLELTATPQVEKNGGAIKFKNVVYEYSLSKAMADGFVKEPAVATRKDFDPSRYNNEELDRIKLEDGIRIHIDTKIELDIYARDNEVKFVKPFVLVVAKDTEHATQLKELISSPSFFNGDYANKVMEVHSNKSGEEKEEIITQLVSLESTENKIEIVIHVNMLKEGWDVTNLYTIIPLRTAASMTLREQTIGRGLRLPYGKRTGNDKVDKLTIVSHDKFQEILDEANKPNSLIKKENIIEIDSEVIFKPKELIVSTSNIQLKYQEEEKRIEKITDVEEKKQANFELYVKKAITSSLPELSKNVTSITQLTNSEIKEIALVKIIENFFTYKQTNIFEADIVKEIKKSYDNIVEDFISNIIEIPRIVIQQTGEVKSGFNDFDLDTKNFDFKVGSNEIVRQNLRDNKRDFISNKTGYIQDNLPNIIINELMNFSEIDYDTQSELLYKLSSKAIQKFEKEFTPEEVFNIVQSNKKEISRLIYAQLKQHHYIEMPPYEKPTVYPFEKIIEHNYSKYTSDSIYPYSETIEPTSDIPNKVFTGFKKACHNLYKFDSKTEKDFSSLLEDSFVVLKWLKPAHKQFRIYWDRNTKLYVPDFVVETQDSIYLCETKKSIDIQTNEVQSKKVAALEYCKNATAFTSKNNGKPWKYLLIPHDYVKFSTTFESLSVRFEVKA